MKSYNPPGNCQMVELPYMEGAYVTQSDYQEAATQLVIAQEAVRTLTVRHRIVQERQTDLQREYQNLLSQHRANRDELHRKESEHSMHTLELMESAHRLQITLREVKYSAGIIITVLLILVIVAFQWR